MTILARSKLHNLIRILLSQEFRVIKLKMEFSLLAISLLKVSLDKIKVCTTTPHSFSHIENK